MAELTHTEWLGDEQYGYINFEPAPEVRELLRFAGRGDGRRRVADPDRGPLDAASRIRGGREAEFWLDTRKMHVFDPETGDNLTRDAEAGAALTQEANAARAEEISEAREREASTAGQPV